MRIEKMKYTLRKAKLNRHDVQLIYTIRNAPDVRQHCRFTEPIPFKDHLEFMKKRIDEYKIVETDKHMIGYLRTESKTFDNWISIGLLPDNRNKGLGKKILKDIKQGNCSISLTNPQSLHAFVKSGWKIYGFILHKTEGRK